MHRFNERAEPAASPLLTSAADPRPGAVAAALTDSAMHAAERSWQHRQPESAALLLAAAGRHLKRWHAANPLADGVEQRWAAIERLSATVEHALYGEPPLAPRIAPARYHPALGAYYEAHPFALTVRNGARDRAAAAIGLGIAATTSVVTAAAPALAAGEETTVPVQLHAAAGAGSTAVPYDTTLWLSAAAEAGTEPVLSAMPFTVEPERCLPEQAVANPGGAAHAAFLHWHLRLAATAPSLRAPAGLSAHRLVDRILPLADVADGGRCLQMAHQTLAALSGSATDWALAVAGVLHQRDTPAALLLSDAAPVLVLAWFEHGGEALDTAAPSLAPAARQLVAAHLEDTARPVPPGRVWALMPHAAAADAGAAAWSAAGSAPAAAAAAALAAGGARLIAAGGDHDRRRPAAAGGSGASPVQALLPLGGREEAVR